jgi:hypothetical protein
MREIRSYGSAGERGGNKPLYPDKQYSVLAQSFAYKNSFLLLNQQINKSTDHPINQ